MSALLVIFAAVNFLFALAFVYVLARGNEPCSQPVPAGALLWAFVASTLFLLAVINRIQ